MHGSSTNGTGVFGSSTNGIGLDALSNDFHSIRGSNNSATFSTAFLTNLNGSGKALETIGGLKFTGAAVGTLGAGKVLTSDASGNATWQGLAGTHNHLGETWAASPLNGLTITNLFSADNNVAIRGFSNNISAVRGKGVLGSSSSPTGIGVQGTNTTGSTFYSPQDNSGVSGVAGTGTGVFGTGYSGRGVWGLSNSAEGVYGQSGTGTAIFGQKIVGATGKAGHFKIEDVANPSSALVAESVGNNALEINNGYLKVDGATKTAFIITAGSGGSTIIGNRVRFSYPNMSNTDILIVNHQYVGNYIGAIGNWFEAGGINKWTIFREDEINMPVGEKFTVLVIKQ